MLRLSPFDFRIDSLPIWSLFNPVDLSTPCDLYLVKRRLSLARMTKKAPDFAIYKSLAQSIAPVHDVDGSRFENNLEILV